MTDIDIINKLGKDNIIWKFVKLVTDRHPRCHPTIPLAIGISLVSTRASSIKAISRYTPDMREWVIVLAESGGIKTPPLNYARQIAEEVFGVEIVGEKATPQKTEEILCEVKIAFTPIDEFADFIGVSKRTNYQEGKLKLVKEMWDGHSTGLPRRTAKLDVSSYDAYWVIVGASQPNKMENCVNRESMMDGFFARFTLKEAERIDWIAPNKSGKLDNNEIKAFAIWHKKVSKIVEMKADQTVIDEMDRWCKDTCEKWENEMGKSDVMAPISIKYQAKLEKISQIFTLADGRSNVTLQDVNLAEEYLDDSLNVWDKHRIRYLTATKDTDYKRESLREKCLRWLNTPDTQMGKWSHRTKDYQQKIGRKAEEITPILESLVEDGIAKKVTSGRGFKWYPSDWKKKTKGR